MHGCSLKGKSQHVDLVDDLNDVLVDVLIDVVVDVVVVDVVIVAFFFLLLLGITVLNDYIS